MLANANANAATCYARSVSFHTKYQSARIGLLIGLVAAAICLYKLSGSVYDPAGARLWFILLIISTIVGVSAGLLRHYYKSRAADIDVQQKIAVETLSAAARRQKK